MSAGRVLGVITARAGSKGIPGKNKRVFAGRPLLSYTCAAAREAKSLTDVLVSSDDEEILALARNEDIEALTRPAELAGDTAGSLEVLQHAVRHVESAHGYRPELIVTLQPTSPLRTGADIDACIALARRHDADAVVSVCESEPHPNWLFRIEEEAGGARLLVPFLESRDAEKTRRQDFDPVYRFNGAMVYVSTYDHVMHQGRVVGGSTVAHPMEAWRSIDLDHPADWVVGELVARHQDEIRERIEAIEREREERARR